MLQKKIKLKFSTPVFPKISSLSPYAAAVSITGLTSHATKQTYTSQRKQVNDLTWPDSEISKFKKAWDAVVEEKSASDPLFKEITASYNKFRQDYSIWSSRAYLKAKKY